jgi:hypothetical protein
MEEEEEEEEAVLVLAVVLEEKNLLNRQRWALILKQLCGSALETKDHPVGTLRKWFFYHRNCHCLSFACHLRRSMLTSSCDPLL